jgi:hypothetical protein
MRVTDFMQAHHSVIACKTTGFNGGTSITSFADFNAAADPVVSAVVLLKHYNEAIFQVFDVAGATGTTVITVEACSAAAGTNNTAIPFLYRVCTTGASDTFGEWTRATAAGFTTTAGADTCYEIAVLAEEVRAASETYAMIGARLKLDEAVDSPVTRLVNCLLVGPKYAASIPKTAIA